MLVVVDVVYFECFVGDLEVCYVFVVVVMYYYCFE